MTLIIKNGPGKRIRLVPMTPGAKKAEKLLLKIIKLQARR